jgi:hypothetical protein
MKRFLIAAVTCSLLGSGPAFAQVGMITGAPTSPGITSPLGFGAPVGATGIPLGATELATPGVSPSLAGTAALGSMTASTACPGIGASAQSTTSVPGTSGLGTSTAGSVTAGVAVPTPLFDSAGMTGNASGTCASGSAISSSSPTASASSPTSLGSTTVGRAGIPLGSTELSPGGLSPLPDITLQSQSSAMTTGMSTSPCVLNGSSPTTATSMSSGGC